MGTVPVAFFAARAAGVCPSILDIDILALDPSKVA